MTRERDPAFQLNGHTLIDISAHPSNLDAPGGMVPVGPRSLTVTQRGEILILPISKSLSWMGLGEWAGHVLPPFPLSGGQGRGPKPCLPGGAAPWVGSPLALVVTNERSGQLGQDKGSYCRFDDST